jgi:hypothetical protein
VTRQPVITRAIEQIPDEDWVDIAYTEGGTAQVAEATWDGWRLIVRRTRIEDDPALPTLFAGWRHHASVTNRPGDAVALDADHRAHAVIGLAIRDVEHGAGLNHCPSGVSTANAAWLLAATLAHNLIRWTQQLGAPASTPLTNAKTFRRRRLTIPGRLTRSTRRWTLHLAATSLNEPRTRPQALPRKHPTSTDDLAASCHHARASPPKNGAFRPSPRQATNSGMPERDQSERCSVAADGYHPHSPQDLRSAWRRSDGTSGQGLEAHRPWGDET